MTDLLFDRAPLPGPPWALVFGAEGEGAAPVIRAVLGGDAGLPEARAPGLCQAGPPPPARLAGDAPLAALALAGSFAYSNNVARPAVARTAGRWQMAGGLRASALPRHQRAQAHEAGGSPRWQEARHGQAALALGWDETLHGIRPWATLRQQDGLRLPAATAARQQQADARARWLGALRQQAGMGVSTGPLTQRHQDGWRDRRAGAAARYQQARPLRTAQGASADQAAAHIAGWLARGQQAMRPPAGGYAPPLAPPVAPPCYVPGGVLVFSGPYLPGGLLLFACERGAGGGPTAPERAATIVIPLLRVYMTTHHMQAELLPSGERVTLLDVQLSADAGSPGWSLSASGPEHLMEQLGGAGAPKQIRLTIDGLPWVFAVERLDRTRAPGLRRVQLSAVSVTLLLGQPYLPVQTWLNAQDATAQQLLAEALQYTGVAVDWQIPDWLVTAGAWSFTGTPLAAAVRIAEAVGAVLQSDPVEPRLRYLPRYPAMPWEWPLEETPADVSMPSAAILTDSLARGDEPQWDAVYVMGTTQGVMARVRRSGSAGALLAPMVADELITHVDAARQRGRAILGAGGRQASITLSMPLLPGATIGQSGPGLLQVGQLLEVVEPAETWRGLVRGVSLAASFSSGQVRQSLRVERHY